MFLLLLPRMQEKLCSLYAFAGYEPGETGLSLGQQLFLVSCLGHFFFLQLVSLAFSQLTQKHSVILCTLGANNDLLAGASIVQGYTADDGFFTA